MQLKVQNIRGIENAAIPLDLVTLVAGGNRAGKTSLLQALAMVASRTKAWPGLSQAQTCSLLVRDGTRQARITLVSEDGEAELVFDAKKGSIELSERGVPPYAPPMAVQVQRLTQMTPANRLMALRGMLQAEPSPEQLAEALAARPLLKNREAIVKRVAQDGWQKVADDMAADARAAKREWERITGQRWSQQRGSSYRPEPWPADPQGAEERVAQLELEMAKYQGGMSPDLREHLQEQAKFEKRPLTDARKRLETMAARLGELETQNLTQSVQVLTCPDCGSVLKLAFGKLESAADLKQLSPEDMQKAHEALAKARSDHGEARRKVEELERAERAADAAKKKLADMPAETGAPPPDLVRELEQAQQELQNFQAKLAADDEQGTIDQRLDLAELLGPDGLRKTVLAERLDELQALATALAQDFALQPIAIDDQGVVHARDHLVEGLSRSEQFLVDVIIQLAVGRMVQADLLVIDDLDIVEPTWKSRLFQILRSYEVPVLIGMMSKLRRKDGSLLVPDLARFGMAPTLWIEEGRVMPLDLAP